MEEDKFNEIEFQTLFLKHKRFRPSNNGYKVQCSCGIWINPESLKYFTELDLDCCDVLSYSLKKKGNDYITKKIAKNWFWYLISFNSMLYNYFYGRYKQSLITQGKEVDYIYTECKFCCDEE